MEMDKEPGDPNCSQSVEPNIILNDGKESDLVEKVKDRWWS